VSNLVLGVQRYSDWRNGVINALERYHSCLQGAQLADGVSHQRLARMRARLAEDKLSIAFVAEFSRGKSELINAIFFAEYGQRIVPSSAGRTTMCPTELRYDETMPPSIRLLPIETRADSQSTSDFRTQGESWTVMPLDVASGDGMLEAFRQVSLTRRVPVEEARRYGLYDESDPDMALAVNAEGLMEISRWRHAIVNFPHPLLEQGLVIIDTPGLNAIGTEPELTLNLIPNAHVVLFILAADTGVTRSDIEVWRNHIGVGAGRLVVLNKIDSMWDELRSADEFDEQLDKQVASVARTLQVPSQQIFPVSAQKALVGRINGDEELFRKSRLSELEAALSSGLIPSRQNIMRAQLEADIDDLASSKRSQLSARTRNVVEQLAELKSLRGKNQSVVEHMIRRIEGEKKEFYASLLKLQTTRAVFARLSFDVFASLGLGILKRDIRATRDAMERSKFSLGMVQAVKAFFTTMEDNLVTSEQRIGEITAMMTAMYRKFSIEHGFALSAPMPFSLEKYHQEIRMIEDIYHKQFGPASIMMTPQVTLMQKFFDTIASRVRDCFVRANRDVETWLKMVMAPLESQISEHKAQLKRRRQSVERIHLAADQLEDRIRGLEQTHADLEAQRRMLILLETELRNIIAADIPPMKAAA
jgi:hypothetical protein